MRDTLSELGRLVFGVLFTIAVIAACKYWPHKGKNRERRPRK
jgi:hypothetical protein